MWLLKAATIVEVDRVVSEVQIAFSKVQNKVQNYLTYVAGTKTKLKI